MSIFSDKTVLKLRCNNAPRREDVKIFIGSLDFKVDPDLIEFITHCDGAEGFISDDSFIQMWRLEDVLSLNPYYDDIEECKDLLFFASDGSNLGFAVDKRTGEFVAIDFLDIGMNPPKTIGSSFRDFLHALEST
jgi:hypothetical protein